MPRVIAGEKGGIPLVTPKGDKTRPTADKVKESLFSILNARLEGSIFLDLFSGSGQIGIEAISRGAKRAVLVESSGKSRAVIRENLNKTGFFSAASVLSSSLPNGLLEIKEKEGPFDIIFMDPPYDLAVFYLDKIAASIEKYGLLSDGGILIVEHRSKELTQENVTNLTFYRRCKYGSTMLTFYTKYD